MSRPVFRKAFLAPKYWLTWMGFGWWWLLVQQPYPLQLWLGKYLGRLMGLLAKRRTAIARRNIELCFPERDVKAQNLLLREHLEALGIGFFELGIAWFWSRQRLQKLVTYSGLEHLKEAEAAGEGVLLIGMHFTHLDCGGIFAALEHSIDGSYRKHSNPLYNFIQRSCRERFNQSMVMERGDVRMMVRRLREGRAIWYAPDQDYGAKHSVFVPFFGVQAATITATSQIARMGRAKVIPFTCIRKPSGGYEHKVYPALEGFPSGDELLDATHINQVVEQAIRQAPEQYLWVHRRFKTRPEGEPDVYTEVGIARGKRQ